MKSRNLIIALAIASTTSTALADWNVSVPATGSTVNMPGSPNFVANNTGATVSTATILGLLNGGSNVSVSTGTTGVEAGNLTLSTGVMMVPASAVGGQTLSFDVGGDFIGALSGINLSRLLASVNGGSRNLIADVGGAFDLDFGISGESSGSAAVTNTASDVDITAASISLGTPGGENNLRAFSSVGGRGGDFTALATAGDFDSVHIWTRATGNLTRAGNVQISAPAGEILMAVSAIDARSTNSSGPSGAGGAVTLSARDGVSVQEINSSASGLGSSGNGGDVSLTSTMGAVTVGGTGIASFSLRSAAGDVTILARGDVSIAALQATATGASSGGSIDITSVSGSVNIPGTTFTNTGTSGNGGLVTINAADNIFMHSITTSGNDAGDVDLSAGDSITMTGNIVGFNSTGSSTVSLAANNLVQARSILVNNAGSSITITGDEIDLTGGINSVNAAQITLRTHTLGRPIEMGGLANNPAALSIINTDITALSLGTPGTTANIGQLTAPADIKHVRMWTGSHPATSTINYLQPVDQNGMTVVTSAGTNNFRRGIKGNGLLRGGPGNINNIDQQIDPGYALAPGNLIFQTTDTNLLPTSTLNIEIGGTAPSLFDSLSINDGRLSLSGALNVSMLGSFTPSFPDQFKIVDIFGGASRTGFFTGFGEGATVGTFGGTPLLITYLGGDGNDIVLYTPQGQPDPLGTLKITKWNDLNRDGIFDSGEPFIPGWEFIVSSTLGSFNTFTGPDGTVTLTGLPVMQYTVTEVMQSGWAASTGLSRTFTLTEAELTSVRFGNYIIPEPTTLGLLAGAGLLVLRRRRSV